MIKTVTVVMLVFASLFLFACSSEISDEEVRVILLNLVPRSQQLNGIFWGNGIKLEDEEAVPMVTVTTAQYYRTTQNSPFKSTGDIKAAAEKVFSRDYLQSVYTIMFEGSGDISPRFADNEDGQLTMDICFKVYDLNTEIFPETAVVKETGAGLIRAEVDCKTKGTPGKMNILLRQQDGVWLIDSPTY